MPHAGETRLHRCLAIGGERLGREDVAIAALKGASDFKSLHGHGNFATAWDLVAQTPWLIRTFGSGANIAIRRSARMVQRRSRERVG